MKNNGQYIITYYGGLKDGGVEYSDTIPSRPIYLADLKTLSLSPEEFDEIKDFVGRSQKYFKYTPKRISNNKFQYVFEGMV